MKILVLNAGSSTVKYQLFDMVTKEVIAKGNAQRIGDAKSFVSFKSKDYSQTVNKFFVDHSAALAEILSMLTNEKHGVIKDINEIDGFGHRVVHGGPKHFDSCIVDNSVIKDLKNSIDLAPLHVKAHLMGLEACRKVAKNIPNVVVFDTGFHSKMPEYAYRYAIPKKDYKKLAIRRYGFHGTSHYFVSNECARLMKKPVEKLKIITIHLGNGSSMSAVKDGRSIDTSMGFTPLEGMVMGTRSGDIDPAVVGYLCKKKGIDAAQAIDYLNKQCGLLGLTGLSADMREILANMDNPDVALALDIMCYRIKKYVGAYVAVLGGVDAIVFTGGIGQYTPEVREKSLQGLEHMGIVLDNKKNYGCERDASTAIQSKKSKAQIWVITTNEEIVIAEETVKLIKNK